MENVTLVPLISLAGPILVNLAKRLLKTKRLQNPKIKTAVHSALPIVIGIGASVINAAASGTAITLNTALTGLAGGAGAAYLRDVDRNLFGIGPRLAKISTKKGSDSHE